MRACRQTRDGAEVRDGLGDVVGVRGEASFGEAIDEGKHGSENACSDEVCVHGEGQHRDEAKDNG